MKFLMRHIARIIVCLLFTTSGLFADWNQAAGPNADFRITDGTPTSWSVVSNHNIAWKITLPETGQSTPVVAGDKVFFTTLKPVEEDSEIGKDIVAWCCSAKTGKVLWQQKIAGEHPLRLSGCFSDSSAPSAVCDGHHVVFINASGTIACFNLDGTPVWSKPILSAGRTLPFLHNGSVVFIRQIYPPEPNGTFPHKYKDSPKDMWTQLQAISMDTGEVRWTTECGVNMGCASLKKRLNDGRAVAVVGRGGGHGPPEKPEGISLVSLADGSTIWTLPLDGFMSTMTYSIRNDMVHLFHRDEHLSISAQTGEIVRRVSILKDVPVRRHIDGDRTTQTETIASKGKGRMITQGSNLLIGPYHYFRSYTMPYLGRVNVENGSVEYLELPLQLVRVAEKQDEYIWYAAPPASAKKSKDKRYQIQYQGILNDVKNSRGFVVMGDKRSVGNGWGHVAAPTPSAAGDNLYVPVMNGTVYVLKWNAKQLNENAIVSINDLGPAGRSWTRASLSFSGGSVFAHTINELICIRN